MSPCMSVSPRRANATFRATETWDDYDGLGTFTVEAGPIPASGKPHSVMVLLRPCPEA